MAGGKYNNGFLLSRGLTSFSDSILKEIVSRPGTLPSGSRHFDADPCPNFNFVPDPAVFSVCVHKFAFIFYNRND
jgi:hypothetical protein